MGELQAPRLVYVSCNPTTLAGNAKDLVKDFGYRLERVRPLDMFPHTPHVESRCALHARVALTCLVERPRHPLELLRRLLGARHGQDVLVRELARVREAADPDRGRGGLQVVVASARSSTSGPRRAQ